MWVLTTCLPACHGSVCRQAVVLVDTATITAKTRDFAKRKAVKGFVDGLLDLITEDDVVSPRLTRQTDRQT